MRKNPTPNQELEDDLKALGVLFSLYLFSLWLGYHAHCIILMLTMNVITFQLGITFHEIYSKPIHLNQFDELDSSMDTDNSLKQEADILNKKLQGIVDEANLRNRKNPVARTPSSSTLAEEGDLIPYSYTEEDNSDEGNPVIRNIPNFSQNHYLHNYMDEVD